MAITLQDLITITDAVNYFNQRAQSVLNQATYYSGNYPKFVGTCTGGRRGEPKFGATESTYLTNPAAIPDNQLISKTINPLTIENGIITAGTLWNSINTIAKTFNKVRYFSSNWQHRYDSTWQNKDTITGRGVFDTSFPAVPTEEDKIDGKSTRWTRSGSNITLTPDKGSMVAGQTISANGFITTIDNCYKEWYNKCFNSNELTYTMYTCHANCHSVCHSNRGRR